jgi:glycosyltransferase involved in cell wall biosynthesis
MTYRRALMKFRLEQIGMSPFVVLGKLYGKLFPYKGDGSIFLFFSSADIGGASKVNLEIAKCVKDKNPLILFSKKPKNNGFNDLFYKEGLAIMDLHGKIDNKLYHFVNFFYRGILAAWINSRKNPVVFGGECLFFYKIIPHLRKDIRCIELCHLDKWLHYSIGLIDRIDSRICSTQRLKETILEQYRKEGVKDSLCSRVHFIENKIDIPELTDIHNPQLEVVYIGRGASQKRVHLIAAIAKKMHLFGLPAHFSFVGDVEKIIDPAEFPFCTFYGNVSDERKMETIYQQSDVLILTSAFEGLPLVVMYMMAYGKVVLSTAVDGIPDYINHLENGLLIRSTEETAIIEEGVELLGLLIDDQGLKTRLGLKSRQIAIRKFSGELFCNEYRKWLMI